MTGLLRGHRSQSIYRGMLIADDTTLKESTTKLAALYQPPKTAEDYRIPKAKDFR
jgi:hypothetical protein